MGMVLFAVSSVSGLSVGRLSKALTPYLIGLFVVLLAVSIIPALSTWFPTLVLGQ